MISTAVIFCGGYGKRLGNITKKIPKPMVLVAKKPFLEHLLLQLKKNGIKKFFFLIGYKNKKITDYFKDGKKWKVNIEYDYNHPNFETEYRLSAIKDRIKNDFLLLYSDNYCPFNLKKNYKFFKENKSLITLNVCKKNIGNVKFINNNLVNYSSTRKKDHYFVDIGYMIIKKELLTYLNYNNRKFSTLIDLLSKKKKVSAIQNVHSYLSISDPKRLLLTRKYFNNRNIVLIDRDGVLNKNNDKFFYVRNLKELFFNYKVINILKKFPDIKYICITNQAGIATGEVKLGNLIKINAAIKKKLREYKINILEYFISPHHFKSNNFFRKPNPGNFIKASKKYQFLLDKTFYIGDDLRDIQAAYNSDTNCYFVGNRNKNFYKFKKKYSNIIPGHLSSVLKKFNEKRKDSSN
jgi:D-glycero-D-manno-heptose 1,7-bisphosphate phosphatase